MTRALGPVIVTGGAGFLGSALTRCLRARGVHQIFVPRRLDFDLRQPEACRAMLEAAAAHCGSAPATVIHCAGLSGGLGLNRAAPASLAQSHLAIASALVPALIERGFANAGVVVQIGHMTMYPADAPLPWREEAIGSGTLDPETAPYGMAKLALLEYLRACAREHGLRSAYVVPTNLYGPGDDLTDPRRTHAAGAIIQRLVQAVQTGASEIECWGTGSPRRDFLFVDDAAEGIVRAAQHVEVPDPINLSTGAEVSLREFAATAARVAGFRGSIRWDTSKPDGVLRRCLDPERARAVLGWSASVGLEEGIRRTIAAIDGASA